MRKLYLYKSDGYASPWKEINSFNNKKEAVKFFDSLNSKDIHYRNGFFIKFNDGTFLKLSNKNGGIVSE